MKRKIHIDELFKNGLKDLSFLVSSKDFEAIEQKKSVFDDASTKQGPLFDDFELEVNDQDWAKTWSKLQQEKQHLDQRDAFNTRLSQLQIEPDPQDWTITYAKYQAAKRRRRAWWYSASAVFVLFSLGIVWLLQAVLFQTPQAQLGASSQGGQSSTKTVQTPSTNFKHFPTKAANASDVSKPKPLATKTSKPEVNLNPQQTPIAPQNTVQNPIANADVSNSKPAEVTHASLAITGPQALASLPLEDPILKLQMQGITHMATAASELPQYLNLIQDFKALPALAKLPHLPPLKQWQYYVAINQSLALSNRTLKSSQSAYRDLRDASDKTSTQFSTGIELGMRSKNQQFSIGINRVQQNENAQFNYQYKVYDSIPVWNPGRTQIVGYFLLNPRDTMINQSTHIVRQHLQVPFKFAQWFQVKPATALGFELGGNVQYTVSSKGNAVLNPDNLILHPYAQFKDQEQRLQLAPRLGVSIQQQLSQHFLLQTTLFGQYGLSNQYKSSFPAVQHNYQYGLNFKLLYLLQ